MNDEVLKAKKENTRKWYAEWNLRRLRNPCCRYFENPDGPNLISTKGLELKVGQVRKLNERDGNFILLLKEVLGMYTNTKLFVCAPISNFENPKSSNEFLIYTDRGYYFKSFVVIMEDLKEYKTDALSSLAVYATIPEKEMNLLLTWYVDKLEDSLLNPEAEMRTGTYITNTNDIRLTIVT